MKKVDIISKKRVFNGFLKVDEYELRHEKFDGSMSEVINRLTIERGDSCAVLIYNKDKEKYVLVNQFRHATYGKNSGWLTELVAGSVPEDETPMECMVKEIEEEAGYKVDSIEHLYTAYTSPGGLSERLFLYYAEVSDNQKVSHGGGLDDEHEDIEVQYYTWEELWAMVSSGKCLDMKAITAVQWVQLKKLNK